MSNPATLAPTPGRRLLYLGCLMLVNLLWAAQYPAYKIAGDHMGVSTLNFWSLLIATLLLLPFMLRERRAVPRGTRVWTQFVILALFGVIPPSVLLAWGVAHSTSANAAILSMTIPVIMSLLGALMLKERLSPLRIASLLLALLGTVVISRSDLQGGSFRKELLIGNAVIFLAGAGSAFYNAYSKKLLETYSELQVLLYGYIVSVVLCAASVYVTGEPSLLHVTAYPLSAWLAVACLGGFSWGIAMVLWMWVLNRIAVSQASVSVYMLSVFGVVLSAITLHERPGLMQIAGGLIVVLATVLATEFDQRLEARRTERRHAELSGRA